MTNQLNGFEFGSQLIGIDNKALCELIFYGVYLCRCSFLIIFNFLSIITY
jgi:hypothetical protein